MRYLLSGREANLRVVELKSGVLDLGDSGAPHGAVITPALFNLAKVGLATKLSEIQGIRHTMCAADVTLRRPGVSEGYIKRSARGSR
ncbi:hypothetical protein HPB48_026920 [Haemaphysalis longicornis]|uniref:Uncharacterized protein n=1 Tax=Haemaphysalis longicornis TaxID=44386 RepID=A0A9J6H2C4_HAELO|nr:hypothetical protein HPB48_026920 [Haemaphysalis longicornis]